ncbi:DUF4238 domain-containing protein [Cobetia sp. 1CM21F]|uniref:DUF4238 domain-containing protein n=1 Tax=Cobetia sp. 1CM21F TaxID=2929163 RepID=UPI0020BF5A90|nr:DUF4238 domain-containing protein [Cobetia sp. 1CM21F]MCK8068110.1 DUF4238 domain-containing protein [Cobetia sp. 1CM21F]
MKDRQHHVWRFYLEAWSENKQLWFSQDRGDPRRTNNKNVAVKRHFYKLKPITAKDLVQLEGLIKSHSCEIVRNYNLAWLNTFEAVLAFIESIKSKSDDPDLHEICDQMLVETEEDMHSRLEDENIPRIEALRNKNTDFTCSQDEYFRFLFFVSLQYLRTKNMQDKFKGRASHDSSRGMVESPEAVWSRSRFPMATSVAASMFFDDHGYNIKFLVNKSSQEFITCDQPVINLKNDPGSDLPPEELIIYYPLSPYLAILITNDFMIKMGDNDVVEDSEVDSFNKLMVSHSGSQLFASQKESLLKYK